MANPFDNNPLAGALAVEVDTGGGLTVDVESGVVTVEVSPLGIGTAGPTPYLPTAAWAQAISYTAGPPASVVTYNNGLYACKTSHTSTSTFDATKWTPILDPSQLNAASATAVAARDATIAARDTTLGTQASIASYLATANAALLSTISYAALAQAGAATVSAQTGLSILAAAQRAIALMTDGAATFVYDTRRDSDGGAWVDKCVSQSMVLETLNTATRGATAKHPKTMLIVGRNSLSAAITIYDMTDPTVPMWAVFSGASLSFMGSYAGSGITAGSISIAALNGKMFVSYGNNEGTRTVDFIADTASVEYSNIRLVWNGRLAERNLTTLSVSQFPNGIQALAHNSIAATVLPNTPLNPLRCNLPNPTVAVGTNSGVSIIRSDGVVCNSASSLTFSSVAFDDRGNLWSLYNGGALYACPPAVYQTASFNITTLANFSLAQLLISSPAKITACGPGMIAVAGSNGLARIKLDAANPANSLINIKTTTYDTGWMVLGKTVLAMAESSGDLSTITAANIINDAFAYADTAAMQAVWVPNGAQSGTDTVSALVGASMQITRGSGGITGTPKISLASLTVGRTYHIRMSQTGTGGSFWSALSGATMTQQSWPSAGSYQFSFVATATTAVLQVWTNASASISITAFRCDAAAADRSGSNNNPIAVGAPTRAVVATGADTAAYSGFSSSAYFDTPYSSVFDTSANGSFCVDSWVFPVGGGLSWVWERALYTGGSYSGQRAQLYISGYVATFSVPGYNTVTATLPANVWSRVSCVARAGVMEIYLNDRKVASASILAANFTTANAIFRVGGDCAGSTGFAGNLALVRFSTYAPTPDQIAFMYADEKGRFAANAQSLLTGANVQGVAWCPDTEQLAAPNSTAGCDVFKGSVRVANDNSAGSTNLIAGSVAPSQSLTGVGASVGVSVGMFSGWGGAGFALIDTAANVPHYLYRAWTAAGSQTYAVTVPVKAAAQGWAQIYLTSGISAYINLATGAVGTTVGSPTVTVNAGASGEWTVTVSGTPSAGAQNIFLKAVTANGGDAYLGTGVAAIYFGKPMLTFGAAVPAAYIDGLSGSANAKAAAFAGGKLAVVTAAGVDVWIPAGTGLRETADGQGAPKRPFYDPTRSLTTWTTANATPVNVPLFIVPEGKSFDFVVRPSAKSFDSAYTNKLKWTAIEGQATRAVGGTAYAKGSTPTLIDPASSTAGISIGYDTTNNLVYATLTGLAANLRWSLACEIIWTDIQQAT